jgi:hypothetical protein
VKEGWTLTIRIESDTDVQQIERCDHDGTTEPLGGLASGSVCTACGKTVFSEQRSRVALKENRPSTFGSTEADD